MIEPSEYAERLRGLYGSLVANGMEPARARFALLFRAQSQQASGEITAEHIVELDKAILEMKIVRKRGRPKDVPSQAAYDRRTKLYLDWQCEKTLDRSLTKLQFALRRLRISKQQYDDDDRAHQRVDALLQDLKPASMKALDEDERRAMDFLYPFVLTESRKQLAREWQHAKGHSPDLTKEQFIRAQLLNGATDDFVAEQLTYLEQGETLLAAERG